MGLYPQAVVEQLRYTPLFCEENIWHLAQALVRDGVDASSLQVILITNRQQQVLLFQQRQGHEGGYVVWDYHVVLRQHDGDLDRIYDFDTRLPFPCNTQDYLSTTFGVQQKIDKALRAELRIIPAGEYLNRFSSDRSHMIGSIEADAFPTWPPIMAKSPAAIPLAHYWDVTRPLDDGSRMMSAEAFLQGDDNDYR